MVAKISCPGQTGPSKSEFEKKDRENLLSRTFKSEFEEKEKDRENLSSGPGQRGPSKSVFEKKIIVKSLVPDKGFLQKVN